MKVWAANILVLLGFIVLTVYPPVELTRLIFAYGKMDRMIVAELNIIWLGYFVAMFGIAMMISALNRRRKYG